MIFVNPLAKADISLACSKIVTRHAILEGDCINALDRGQFPPEPFVKCYGFRCDQSLQNRCELMQSFFHP